MLNRWQSRIFAGILRKDGRFHFQKTIYDSNFNSNKICQIQKDI